MKVMQLLPELNSGGVERGTLEIGRALVASGHQSLVVSNGGRMVPQLEQEGTRHLQLAIHQKSFRSLFKIRPLRRLILQEQPDIVHVRSRVPAWLTHFALRGMPQHNRPHLISTVHGLYSVNGYSAIMTRAERVIAVSDTVVDYIQQHYPNCPKSSIVRIYRGISLDEFPHGYQPPAAWWQMVYQLFPQLENKTLISLPGRITRLKGHDYLFELIAALKKEFNVHGVVVGGADDKKQGYLDQLQQRVTELNLQDHVTFVGHRRDIREWLAASDLVLSLSTQPETFGRTTLEALALGTAVVGWNRGGVAEILKRCYPTGCVEPENAQALFNKVQQLLASPIAPAPVQDFQLSHMTDQTIALYQEVTGLK